jgi:hypothetical protein
LIRFRIVEEVCLRDFETVNHLIWHCERLETEKLSLTDALTALDEQFGTPVHGFVCSEEVAGDEVYYLDFLGSFGIKI